MAEPLTLTDAEKTFLVEMLERALKDARVEEHRTRTLSYREFVLQQENAILGIMKKLGHTPA
jgi:hypothetical protein